MAEKVVRLKPNQPTLGSLPCGKRKFLRRNFCRRNFVAGESYVGGIWNTETK